MLDLESSFELLSSMSPNVKFTRNKKKPNRSPTKLTLKYRVRRSSILDRKPHSHHVLDSSVIVIDDSLIENNISPANIKIQKAPNLVSSTSDSDFEERKFDQPLKIAAKHLDIENWLSENEKSNGNSEVYSFKNKSDYEDGIENKKKTSPNVVKNLNKSCSSWQNEKSSLKPEISDDVTDSSITEFDKSAENILDNLYGTSWRENKHKIIPNSEPRKAKKHIPINMSKTERKPRNTKKEKSDNIEINLLRTVQLKNTTKPEFKSPWAYRLKGICDSDSSDSFSDKSFSDNRRKLSFSDSGGENDYPLFESKKLNSAETCTSPLVSGNINILSDSDESLGTKVRKKLVKKTKKIDVKNDLDKNKNSTSTRKPSVKQINPKNNDLQINVNSDKVSKSQTSLKQSGDFKYSFLKSLSGCIPSWHCNIEAKLYKENFKTKKDELAKKLFDLYNEKIFDRSIPSDTPLQWNNRMLGTAGFCYNKRIIKRDGNVLRSCRIVLATKILDTADRLRDTLVHEMCHAATWLVNGVCDGHGAFWKSWAQKAMHTFPELPPIKRCHDYQINTKFTYKCMDCGYSIGRHSKSLDIERKRCGYCYGKFEIFINKVNKHGEKQTTPATPKEKGKPVTGFALYVKENYSLVKKEHLKHNEVMKILGQQFSALKVQSK